MSASLEAQQTKLLHDYIEKRASKYTGCKLLYLTPMAGGNAGSARYGLYSNTFRWASSKNRSSNHLQIDEDRTASKFAFLGVR